MPSRDSRTRILAIAGVSTSKVSKVAGAKSRFRFEAELGQYGVIYVSFFPKRIEYEDNLEVPSRRTSFG